MDSLRRRAMQSGNPLSVNAANDNLGFGGGTANHADKVGTIAYPKTLRQWFSPNAFAQPAPMTLGNSPKNTVKGPGRDNWNLSLYKDFKFNESAGFQFRAETFNTLNHTQFTGVNNVSSPVTRPTHITPLPDKSTQSLIRVSSNSARRSISSDLLCMPPPWRTEGNRFRAPGHPLHETVGTGGSQTWFAPTRICAADLTAIWPWPFVG